MEGKTVEKEKVKQVKEEPVKSTCSVCGQGNKPIVIKEGKSVCVDCTLSHKTLLME